MPRFDEAVKHNKLCPRRPILARCVALIAALIYVLSTSVCADGLDNYIYQSSIVNQSFAYFEQASGATKAGTYQAFTMYNGINYPADNYNFDYLYMRYAGGATGNLIKYIYIPLFQASSVSISMYTSGSSTNVAAYKITAVDSINAGVATPCEFSQSSNHTAAYSLIKAEATSVSGNTTSLVLRKCTITTPGKTDILRLTIDTTVTGNIYFGIFEITPIANVTSISEGIQNIVSTINQQTTDINNNNNSNTQSIVNTVIKYGDDANYYLEAITYSTQDQQLVVNTTKQKFNTALQALQAQNQIIHNNVINNAPTENQVQQVISKEQIAPDVDVAVIGGGTSDSGIGIIMSQTKVIAMMVLVMGIAILSYLLFGRKT